jgi:uncharacterized protein YkwD
MLSTIIRFAVPAILALTLAACSGGQALPPGVSQGMDKPGAQLNREQALAMVNQYRGSVGAGMLVDDPTLDAQAQAAAAAYAKTGRQTPKPEGTIQIRYSAGYANFAETFSGWRNSPQDSAALTDRTATRAGLAVTYEAQSPYGVYWVMIVG